MRSSLISIFIATTMVLCTGHARGQQEGSASARENQSAGDSQKLNQAMEEARPTGRVPLQTAPPVPKATEVPAAPVPKPSTPAKKLGGSLVDGLKGLLTEEDDEEADSSKREREDEDEASPADEKAPTVGEDSKEEDEKASRINELSRTAAKNFGRNRVEAAIGDLNQLIGIKPYDTQFHLALGLCFRQKGDNRQALKKYDDVLDLGGPKAFLALLKADIYATEGRKPKAFEMLKKAAIGGRNIINDVRQLDALKNFQHDTAFIKLALQLEKVEVNPSKTRDPFTNPFDVRGEDQKNAGDVVLGPEEQEALLSEVKRLFDQVKFFVKLEDENKAMDAYTKLKKVVQQEDRLTIPKIQNDFRLLMGRMEELEVEIEGIRLRYYYRQAQDKIAVVKEHFANGDYGRVEAVHDGILKLAQEMKQANPRYGKVAERVVAVATKWLDRAKVRQEFQSIKPSIEGIIISDEGKMAVLGSRVVKQGEFLDDFRIVRIENNKVTFRYKGEDIPLVFRRY